MRAVNYFGQLLQVYSKVQQLHGNTEHNVNFNHSMELHPPLSIEFSSLLLYNYKYKLILNLHFGGDATFN